MKPKRNPRHYGVLLICALALWITSPLSVRANEAQILEDTAVQDAWGLAQEIGVYHFSSDVRQTTYPAPAIANLGRSSTTETYYLEGEVDSPAQLFNLILWTAGGNRSTQEDGVEIRVEGDQAYGRQIGGTWQELDDFSGLFAPGSDPLAYLAGATHIQRSDPTTPLFGITRYTFDLDGPAFAAYLRQQLEDQLRRSGNLPTGLSLDTPRAYQALTGSGEVWLSQDGLPLRLLVDLEMPDAGTGERIAAQIKTDFSAFQQPTGVATASLSALGTAEMVDGLPQFVFWALCAVLLVLFWRFYRSKKMYAAIVLVVIVSMVVTPLLQSAQIAAFYDQQEDKQLAIESAQQDQAARQQARQDLLTSNWDPQSDPSAVLPVAALQVPQPETSNLPSVDLHSDPSVNIQALPSINETLDSDQDGLSDELERQLGSQVDLADSDGDTLLDGPELLRLGTDPLSNDSDGDGIYDQVEIAGYVDANGQHWYLDPNNADSNQDHRTDTLECHTLVAQQTAGTLACPDTDKDGTPDVFDRDDDGDGVADPVDLYPDGLIDRSGKRTNGSSTTPFNDDNPFKLKINSLQTNRTVFVDFQLRTQNPDHLTYALNVLDWPSEDVEGQIQHVKHTTFASQMTDEQVQYNPSLANGDMQVIPMLEITLTGDAIPLANTTPSMQVVFQGELSATITLEQASDPANTLFSFDFADPGSYTAKLYTGGCPVSGSPLNTFTGVSDGNTRTVTHRVVNLADGEHALTLSDGDSTLCSQIGNIVNGPYADKMIDPEPLTPYGISVREIDGNGNLAAYIPLSMVPDETGGGREAFAARMVYQVGQGAAWQQAQQVRVVWLLEMLVDQCDPEGFDPYWTDLTLADPTLLMDSGAKDAAFRTWCSLPEHRSDDQMQIVQTYNDSWYLTGMTIREEGGLDMAVIYEDADSGDPLYSTHLWQLSMGLGYTFIGAHDCVDEIASNDPDYDPDLGRCHEDGTRDISIYSTNSAGEKIGNTNLYERFDPSGSVPDGDDRRWGIPIDSLQVERFRYTNQDYQVLLTMDEVPRILENNFAHDDQPTLLFAREEHYRAADIGDTAKIGSVFSVDMSSSNIPVDVIAGLKWMPYRYNDTQGWQTIPVEEYWDQLEILYTDLFEESNPEDTDKMNLGSAIIARSYYVSLMQGLTQQVQNSNRVLSQKDAAGEDSDSFMAGLVDTGQAGTRIGKAVAKWVIKLVKEIYDTYGFRKMLAVSSGSMGTQGAAISRQILLESTADSIYAHTSGPWKTIFSAGIKGKIGIGVAIAGAVAVVGLTIYGATQQTNPLEMVQVVLIGLGALAAINTVAASAQAVIQAARTAGSLSAAIKNGFASATAQTQAAANKGAIVGLVIGVVVAWAAIAVQAGLSYGLGGGMSGIEWGTAIAGAIAATVVAVIMFVITLIPVIGQLIGAIIALIDAVIGLLCTVIFSALGKEQSESAAANWFCGGLTGLVTKILTVLIYSGNVMVELYPEEGTRLEFYDFMADDLVDPELGISVGNRVRYSLSITNTITIAPLPDDLGAAYRYQYNDKQLRSSSFDYSLSITNTLELHENLERYTTSDWAYVDGDGPEWGDFGHTWHKAEPVYINRSVQHPDGIPFETAGINQEVPLYLLEGWALPSQNCILGICTIWTESGTENYNLGGGIKFDVFPATLDGFYTLAAKNGGYALGWAQSGEVTFPRLVDGDGDGIPYPTDAHDNTWDNDGDGLSDGYEVKLGTNPDQRDSDGDGLADRLELIAETNPLRPDSDGDGLMDGLEVLHQDIFDQNGNGNTTEWLGGWDYAYYLNTDGSVQSTWVIPSPLNADSDGDTLTDAQEKAFGFNPNWVSVPNILTFQSTISEADGTGGYLDSDGYIAPGDTLQYTASIENELFNRWAQGLLDTDFPAVFSTAALNPQPFLLYPMEQQVLQGEVTVDEITPSGVYSLTQTAGALISDWAELASGANLWYPFEDDTSAVTFADRSGSIPAQDGSCTNSVPLVGCVPVKDDGVFGGALLLDGTAAITAGYNPSESAYAISMWFKTTHADGGLFEVRNIWDRWLYMEGGKVKAKMYNGTSFDTIAGDQLYNDGKWHHVVHTFGGAAGKQKLYVDGQQVATGTFNAGWVNDHSIRLGYANVNSVGYFNGKIEDVRLYTRGLTFNEVQTLFDTPVLDLRFNENSGWKDASPFQNNPTCNSGTCPSSGDGIDGRAVKFDGYQYLTIPSDDSLKLNQGGFTIGVWIYPTQTPQYCYQREFYSPDCDEERPQPQGILGFGSGEDNAYPTLQRVGNQLRFTYGDKPYFTSGDVLQSNRWNHIAVTYDGSALLLYVNGALVAEDSTTFTTPPPGIKTFTIGRSGTAASLEVKKIRVEDEGDGAGSAEFCMAFQSGGDWQSVFNQSVDGGLVDGSGFPLLYNVTSGPFDFNDSAYLLVWEDDGGEKCVTDANKTAITPKDDGDDSMGLWTFRTTSVSEGYDQLYATDPGLDPYRHYATSDYAGDASGYFYYVFENDSLPFYGKIDELLVYNRPFTSEAIWELYQAHRLALHLQFDDPPGETSFQDASFGQHHATCSGDHCPVSGVAGRINQGTLFDGNDYLTLANSNLNHLTNEFSVAAWIKPGTVSGFHRILATARTASNNGFAFGTYDDGLRFTTFGHKDYDLTGLGLLAGQWNHVAAVMDSSNAVSFYVNGVFQGKVSGPSPATADTDDVLLIGTTTATGTTTYSQFFEGEIDELYIFSNALGESAIAGLYQKAPTFQLHLNEAQNAITFRDESDNHTMVSCTGEACPQVGFSVDGQLGTAARFDGQDDYLYTPYLQQVVGNFSLSAWVYPTALRDTAQPIFVHTTSGAPNYGVYIQPDSMTPRFMINNASGEVALEAESSLVMNTWNHIVGTYDGQAMNLYLNGTPQGSRSISSRWIVPGPFRIGGDVAGTVPFSGQLDEITLYGRALSASDVADIFGYQSKWVEERQSHNLAVDDDAPSASLKTSGPYLPNTDVQMLITANDPTSGIQRVQFGVKAPGQSVYTWNNAPLCQDAALDTAWCPTLIPTGAGIYALRARVTDLVGHSTTVDASVTVDDLPPSASFDFGVDALLLPSLSDTQPNTWVLSLSGTISDAGSGLAATSLQVSLLDSNDFMMGGAAQRPALNGNAWRLEYRLTEPYPSGDYTVTLRATDLIALRTGLDDAQIQRHTLEVSRAIQIDAAPPVANLDRAGLPPTLSEAYTLAGQATDRPVDLHLVWDTDSQADQLGLALACNGIVLHQFQPGALPALADSYSWSGSAPWDAACQVELNDLGGDGGTRGSIVVCGSEIASWESDFGGSHMTSFNALADSCGSSLSVSGMASVETALVSTLPGSPFNPESHLPGTTLHLPFDDIPTANDTLSFGDLIESGRQATCSGETCPTSGQLGHLANAVFFDGLDDNLRLAQDTDLGTRETLSLALWLRPQGNGTGMVLFKENELALWRDPQDGQLYWMLGNTTPGWGNWQSSGISLPGDQWTHLALVYDNGTVRTYTNGALAHTGSASGTIPNLSDLSIGGGAGKFYGGWIDDLQLFSGALSAAEIRTLYLGNAPVLLLHLDEAWANQNTVIPDASGWGQDGILVTSGTDPANKAETGKVGPYALHLDGDEDRIRVPDNAALDLSQFSVGLWLKPDWWSYTVENPLLYKGSGTHLNYGLSIAPNGALRFRLGDATCSSLQVLETGAMPLDQWTHILATYDGTDLNLYRNGQLDQKITVAGGACLNDDPLILGTTGGAEPTYQGLIDEIVLYPRALGATEVLSQYVAGWQPALAAPTGNGVDLSDWTAALPAGLEGDYRLELRATDTNDTTSAPQAAWQGQIDTLAPRVTLDSQIVGETIQYTASATDWNLSLEGYTTPCGAGAVSQQVNYQSPWYQALAGGTERLYQLVTQCERSVVELPGEVGAYDTPGLAYGLAISGTLAYIADGDAGVRILDVSNPINPQNLGALEGIKAYAVDVAPGGPVLYPDLVVESLAAEPSLPALGQPFVITATIRNLGSGIARNFVANLFQDYAPSACQGSTTAWTAAIPRLDPGAAVAIGFNHTGLNDLNSHTFYAKADGLCTLQESDEGNNLLGPWILAAGQPDLLAGSMQIDPAIPIENQPFTITAVITNQGTLPTTAFSTTLYIDQSVTYGDCGVAGWESVTVPALDPAETRLLTFVHPGLAFAGVHEALLYVDSGCAVSESAEGNNLAGVQFDVISTPKPDLLVTNLQASKLNPFMDESFVVTATLHNQGVTASGAFTATAFLDAQPTVCGDMAGKFDELRVGSLDPGESIDVAFTQPGIPTLGQHFITVQPDSHCEVDELDEVNNTSWELFVSVIDPNQPDVVISGITTEPLSPAVDSSFIVSVTVTNLGLGDAANFDTTIYFDNLPSACDEGYPDWYFVHTDLLAGESSTVVGLTYPGFATAEEHTLYAQADGSCSLPESNENNNISEAFTVTVTASAPDLTFEAGENQPVESTVPPLVRLLPTTAPDTTPLVQDYAYAHVATHNGLAILDVSDPAAPILVSSLPVAGATRQVKVVGDITYLVTQFDGLHTIDTANPGYPGLLDSYDTPGLAEGLALAGNYALVADGSAGLQVIDIGNPEALGLASTYDTSGYAAGVTYLAPYAYIADGYGGLLILDMNDPLHPTLAGQYTSCFAIDVAAVDHTSAGGQIYAYIATGSGGISVIDVTDPAHPQPGRIFDTPGYTEQVAISNATGIELAYIADRQSGLRIINPTGTTPTTTACDTAGHCTSLEMTQSLADLARLTLAQDPQTQLSFPQAESSIAIEILGLPPVLDSTTPLTITGQVSSTLTTLEVITVTLDGAPLPVSGWVSGGQQSNWQVAWSPAGDGPHIVLAQVLGGDGSTASQALSVTLDTTPPEIGITPTLYTGADYTEPRTIDLRGTYSDAGGVTAAAWRVEGGEWSEARLENGIWHGQWQLESGPLPDLEDFTILARATDIAGHTRMVSTTVTVDVRPPEAVVLTLTGNGAPLEPGAILRETSADFELTWDASQDNSGLDDYRVRWTSQATDTLLGELTETVSWNGTLASAYRAAEAQKLTVELGSRDTLGNPRWQPFGDVYLDSPLTPDYIPTIDDPYRGWMESGCTRLGIDRRASRIYANIPAQTLYATWDARTLRLAWLGGNWYADGDLFIYLDATSGGTSQVFDPFGAGYTITLPEGMLADYLVWVPDGGSAALYQWTGGWTVLNDPLPAELFHYTWDAAYGTLTTDLFLPFESLGLDAGEGLNLLGLVSENNSLNLWASLPNTNPVNSERALGRLFTLDGESDFQLSQFYHWDSLNTGICPNGSTQPESGAYLDVDLQVSVSAEPAGTSFSLLQDGLSWLQDLLLGSPPADVSTQLENLTGDSLPLHHGQVVTYTLSYHNLGTDTAYGMQANLEAQYALTLPGGSSIPMGDIPPDGSGSITFTGLVDTGASSEPWAGVAVQIFDTAHPETGAPIEWLWTHHRVDTAGPEFFGIQQPLYLLGAGSNSLSGYAYDPAGVANLEIRLQEEGGTVNCPDASPFNGNWSCDLAVSGENNQFINLELQATDSYGLNSLWGPGQIFMLDTQPPAVTLDLTATGVISGSLFQGSQFTLYGQVADNGGLGTVEVCAHGDCRPADLYLQPGAPVITVGDTPPTATSIDGSTTCGGSEIVGTFWVTDTFPVGNLQFGFAATHEHRDDLQVTLIAPSGTEVRLLSDDGISGTDFQGANFWFDDAAPLDFSQATGDLDPSALDFEIPVRPDQPLNAFWGQEAQGWWRVEICDLDPAAHDGSYLGSQLRITPQDPYSKAGNWSHTVSYDTEGMDYVLQEIEVYAQDLVGNRSAEPQVLPLWIDTVAPVITVTHTLTEGELGAISTVLEGFVTEGGPLTDLSVHVYPPEGDAYRSRPAQSGDAWQFDLSMDYPGIYQLWVTAGDAAGNLASVGPFEVLVRAPTLIYMPTVFLNFTSGPDLVVQHILVTENNVEVTLVNRGNAPVTDGFWVDLYIDPDPLPTAVNQTWDQVAEQGIVWGVTDVSQLVPNGSLTLDLDHPAFMAEYSDFEGTFSPEMAIYVQVDSFGLADYGSILELDEIEGSDYNNIKGPVYPLPVLLDQRVNASEPSGLDSNVSLGRLPERPVEVK